MTITYESGDSLYLNLTNRCSNSCDFCVRTQADGFYADDLWLEREPTVAEICADLDKRALDKYKNIVFCGYGEPTERYEDMFAVCDYIKSKTDLPVRINTNGQGSLIAGHDITPGFAGRFDIVSVSLNAPDAKSYDAVCHSVYGEAAFDALLDFTARVKQFVPKVLLSVVRGSIPDTSLDRCAAIADKCGVTLRIREYIKTQKP